MTVVKKVGDFSAWIEQESSIHVKACTVYGDPIELSTQEIREVIRLLAELADELERLDK